MKSPKEVSIDAKIIAKLEKMHVSPALIKVAETLLNDPEIQAMQEFGNTVSIKRLGFNDHGPVHMRTVALNAIKMLELLRQANVQTSLEREETGNFDDSLCAVLFAALLHDFGMTMGRLDHEQHSTYLSYPIISRILHSVYKDDIERIVAIRSIAMEAIYGHMGNRSITSLEAGVVQVADGCDMEKGRARIPMAIGGAPKVGDIHQYSAHAIEELRIGAGKEKPIRIEAVMTSEVGLFQIEEVLLGKIHAGTAKPYIELYATLKGEEPKRYL
ncbi:MAG: phosphohydrolase [Spirochaetaceae bacterium]|jgi:metal-dependent HD superfamily phosphatase/phosphodiesterase|nr:phosphohydrolase [Spirochaetaceae bacterium]